MAAICAREKCGKTVYPLEELKCMDKVWHKQCFKCQICGMTLTVKTYKAYDKLPYCQSHYPKVQPISVTDTPLMVTAKANKENQSMVQYHSQYEKSKGKRISVSDGVPSNKKLSNASNADQPNGEAENGVHAPEQNDFIEQQQPIGVEDDEDE